MSPSVLRSDHNRFFLCHGYRRRTASVSRAAAEAVVRTALRAWDSRRALAISGWKNRFLVLGRFAPRWMLVRVSAAMMGH
jgi:hypothetical protein